MIFLRALGAPRYSAGGGEERDIAWQIPGGILLRLALHDGWMDRAALAAWLRPDADEATARAYLRRLLHRARELPWAKGLEADATRVRYPVESDAREVMRAYQARDWTRVVESYGGPFVDGASPLGLPPLDDWVQETRDRLKRHWRAATFAHAETLEEQDDMAEAFALLERVVDGDLLDEEALQMLMSCAGSDAEVAIALQRFDAFSAEAAEALGVRPLPATSTLARNLRDRGPRSRGRHETRLDDNTRAALPPDHTPLVGRKRELAELAGLLANRSNRLITLVGLGGTGKTRLAVAAARAHAAATGGAAWLVKLSPVTERDGILYAIGDALGVRLGGADLLEALVLVLAERSGLMVLDNTEHLPAAAEIVRALLDAAPGISWLATSRVPLGLMAEWRFPVQGLETQDGGDAYQLLESAARRHGRAGITSGDDAAAIAAICRLVEGSPLALEIAGSWAGAMSFPALAAEIGTSLGFLVATDADREARHASLEAVFETSWAQLAPPLRTRLARLGIFAGGFDAAAARAVADATVAELLQLAGHSLLRRIGADRFDVHPLIHQFSSARIEARERPVLAQRHAAHYIGWITDDPNLRRGIFDRRALERVEADFANITAAWGHAVAHGMLEALAASLPNIDTIFARRGRDLLGYRLYQDAVAAAPAGSELRARFEVRLAGVADSVGRKDEARALHQSAAPLLVAPADLTVLQNGLCVALSAAGNYREALEKARAAVQIAQDAGRHFDQMHALQNLCIVELQVDDLDPAEQHILASIALAEKHNAPHYLAAGRYRLAHVRNVQKRPAEARTLLEQALVELQRCGDRYYETYARGTLCEVKTELGDTAGALADARETVRLADELGITLRLPMILATAAWAELACDRHADARATARRGLDLAMRHGVMAAQLRLLLAAAALLPRARAAEARQWIELAAAHPSFRGDYRREVDRARQLVVGKGNDPAVAIPLPDALKSALAFLNT